MLRIIPENLRYENNFKNQWSTCFHTQTIKSTTLALPIMTIPFKSSNSHPNTENQTSADILHLPHLLYYKTNDTHIATQDSKWDETFPFCLMGWDCPISFRALLHTK
jgi:hypothetical protein